MQSRDDAMAKMQNSFFVSDTELAKSMTPAVKNYH